MRTSVRDAPAAPPESSRRQAQPAPADGAGCRGTGAQSPTARPVLSTPRRGVQAQAITESLHRTALDSQGNRAEAEQHGLCVNIRSGTHCPPDACIRDEEDGFDRQRTGYGRRPDRVENRWAVVHVEDVAELYVAALGAPAGGVYAGVDDSQSPTMRQIAEAVSVAAGQPGTAGSITTQQARAEFGPLADAFVFDQRISAARARRELAWKPGARDVLAELSTGG